MPRKPKNGADDEPAGEGDNSANALTADQRAEYFSGFAEFMSERNRLNYRLKQFHEEWEAKGATTFDKKAVSRAFQAAAKDKKDTKAQYDADVKMLLATSALTVADVGWAKAVKQVDMFNPTADANLEVAGALAYEMGRKAAAIHGLARSTNRFEPGSRQYQRWDEGWSDGNDDRINAGLGPAELLEKKKPGRPKAAAVPTAAEVAEVVGEALSDVVAAGMAPIGTRDPAEPPAATMDEAMERSRAHLGGDLPEPPAPIH